MPSLSQRSKSEIYAASTSHDTQYAVRLIEF